MTYNTVEQSQSSSEPYELYRFTRGLTTWRYTTADADVTFDSEVYLSVVVRRGQLPQNEERDNATLDLFVDPTVPMIADFIEGSSAAPTNVILLRRHRPEAGLTEQAVLFAGQVGIVEFSEAEAHLTCVPMQKAMARPVPRWIYQTTCNHMLYDAHCGKDPAAFTITGTIGAIVGRTMTVTEAAAKPDGYFNGGYIRDGDTYAFIMTHVGETLELLAATSKLHMGDAISLTAGCDHTQPTCIAKFDNLENFMGFPFIPDNNPYDGLSY